MGQCEEQVRGCSPAQVEALATRAAQLPEVRLERVQTLRQAIAGGNYHRTPEEVATALFLHMIAGSTK